MKKTLYEILGVDSDASKEQIEQAYIARVDELKFATLQDPNKLRVLQSSKEILTDPGQRANYDATLARAQPALKTSAIAEPDPEPSFLQQWGKWMVIAVVAVIAVVYFARHRGSAPPPQASQVAKPAAPKVEAAPPPKAMTEAASAPVAVAPTPAPAPSAADVAAEPLLGDWNCTDAISGRTSRYAFRPGGVLVIASTDGQAELKFEFSGKSLTLTDASKVSTWTAEEIAARKIILNTGAEGRRVVCKR